jgi:hypothetical protein
MGDLHVTTLGRWEAGRMTVAWTHELNIRLAALAVLGPRVDDDPQPLTPFATLRNVDHGSAKASPLALEYLYSAGRWARAAPARQPRGR